jgi:hypothetical protein
MLMAADGETQPELREGVVFETVPVFESAPSLLSVHTLPIP